MRELIKKEIVKKVNEYYKQEVIVKNRARKVVLKEIGATMNQSTRNVERYISAENKPRLLYTTK